MGKLPFSFLSPAQNRGGVGGAGGPGIRRPRPRRRPGRGGNEGGERGGPFPSLTQSRSGLWRGRWRPADDGRNGYGGGAVGSGRGRAEAGVAVVARERHVALFIGEIRRWGEPWGGGRGAVGRRAPRAELMAGGRFGLSPSGVQRRGRRGRSLWHVEGEAGRCY